VQRIGCRMFRMVQLANQHNYCGVGSYYLVSVADQWYNKKSIYQALLFSLQTDFRTCFRKITLFKYLTCKKFRLLQS
jgi:hypothetical protein